MSLSTVLLVVLILAVVSVAIYFLVPSFIASQKAQEVEELSAEIQENSASLITCTYTNVRLSDVIIDSENNIKGVIDNVGQAEATGMYVTVSYSSGSSEDVYICDGDICNLEVTMRMPFSLQLKDDFDSLSVRTGDCGTLDTISISELERN